MAALAPEGSTPWGGRPVARTLAAAEPRTRVQLCVLVTAVQSRAVRTADVVNGASAGPSQRWEVDATAHDGTGTLTLRWFGRAEVPGIVPGVTLEVEGTLALAGEELVLLNPVYQFLVEGPGADGSPPDGAYSSSSW